MLAFTSYQQEGDLVEQRLAIGMNFAGQITYLKQASEAGPPPSLLSFSYSCLKVAT